MARESRCFWILQPWLLATTKKSTVAQCCILPTLLTRKSSSDTDVVLAVGLAGTLKEEIEVWVSISTGKSFCILAGHEIARAVDPEKAQALPMFDALTDCDTVSCFAGHGQKTAWIVWTVDSSTRADQTLTLLSTVPDHIDENAMHTHCFTTEQAP